jgi:MarR family transcriptional regulator, organic hydroperoxide resistance regulator
VNPNLKLAYSINQTADYLNKQADIVLKRDFGISYRQYLIFVGLQYMQPCSQKQVAEFVQLTSAGVLHLLKELENSGWVKKEYDEADRRTVVIKMTTKGSEAFERMNTVLGDRLNEIIDVPASDAVRAEAILGMITTPKG